eukprot:Opistho-2@79218
MPSRCCTALPIVDSPLRMRGLPPPSSWRPSARPIGTLCAIRGGRCTMPGLHWRMRAKAWHVPRRSSMNGHLRLGGWRRFLEATRRDSAHELARAALDVDARQAFVLSLCTRLRALCEGALPDAADGLAPTAAFDRDGSFERDSPRLSWPEVRAAAAEAVRAVALRLQVDISAAAATREALAGAEAVHRAECRKLRESLEAAERTWTRRKSDDEARFVSTIAQLRERCELAEGQAGSLQGKVHEMQAAMARTREESVEGRLSAEAAAKKASALFYGVCALRSALDAALRRVAELSMQKSLCVAQLRGADVVRIQLLELSRILGAESETSPPDARKFAPTSTRKVCMRAAVLTVLAARRFRLLPREAALGFVVVGDHLCSQFVKAAGAHTAEDTASPELMGATSEACLAAVSRADRIRRLMSLPLANLSVGSAGLSPADRHHTGWTPLPGGGAIVNGGLSTGLRGPLAVVRKAIVHFTGRLRDSDSRLAAATAELGEARCAAAEALTGRALAEGRLAECEAVLQEASARVAAAERVAASSVSLAEHQALTRECEALKRRLADACDERNMLSDAVEKSSRDVAGLAAESGAARRFASEREAEIKALSIDLAGVRVQLADRSDECTRLQTLLAHAEEAAASSRRALVAGSDSNAVLRRDLNEAQDRSLSCARELDVVRGRLAAVEKELVEYRAREQQGLEAVRGADAAAAAARHRVAVVEGETQRFKKELEVCRQERAALLARCASLHADLGAQTTHCERLKRELAAACVRAGGPTETDPPRAVSPAHTGSPRKYTGDVQAQATNIHAHAPAVVELGSDRAEAPRLTSAGTPKVRTSTVGGRCAATPGKSLASELSRALAAADD